MPEFLSEHLAAKSVVLYSKPDCPACTKAERLLNSKGVIYSKLTLGVDFQRDDIMKRFPRAMAYPVVVIDNQHIGSYLELERILT